MTLVTSHLECDFPKAALAALYTSLSAAHRFTSLPQPALFSVSFNSVTFISWQIIRCGGLNETGHLRLVHSNACSPVGGTVWEELGRCATGGGL